MENKPNAYEYLYATIQSATWISEAYKKFAEKYKNTEKPLRELYLCFCDMVPLDILEMAELREPVESSFRQVRQKHMESELLKRHADELERIKNITSETENEVKSISNTLNIITEAIPTFDEMFMAPVEVAEPIEQENIEKNNVEEPKTSETKEVPVSVVPEEKAKEPVKQKLKWREVIKNKVNGLIPILKNDPRSMVVNMLAQGYSDSQINLILDCIECGMTEKDIKSFADPKISPDIMKKLIEIKKKELEKNEQR